jgi:hypothetical protein
MDIELVFGGYGIKRLSHIVAIKHRMIIILRYILQ